jgi:VanZ family protein
VRARHVRRHVRRLPGFVRAAIAVDTSMASAPEPPPDSALRTSDVPTRDAKSARWRPIFPVLYAAVIFLGSSRAGFGPPLPGQSDKLVHFLAFGLLATATCRIGHGWKAALWALLAVSAYGAADEWHQSFVPMRSSDFFDWVADTLGAGVAVSVYQGWPRFRRLLEFQVKLRPRRTRHTPP